MQIYIINRIAPKLHSSERESCLRFPAVALAKASVLPGALRFEAPSCGFPSCTEFVQCGYWLTMLFAVSDGGVLYCELAFHVAAS